MQESARSVQAGSGGD